MVITDDTFLNRNIDTNCPANIRLDEDVLKTSFVFRTRLQDVLMKTNMFALALRLQKTSPRRLKDVLVKTNIFVLAVRLQDVFKTSWQDVLKTFLRRLQDVFKTYYQVKLFLVTQFQDIFKTYSKRFWDILLRRLSTGGLPSLHPTNLWSLCKIPESDKDFSSFNFSLYYTF